MKLNNNGWGMKEMVLFMAILLMFLLVAAYNVNRLYTAIDSSKNNVSYTQNNNSNNNPVKPEEKPVIKEEAVNEAYYSNLEGKFKNATREYIKDYKYDLSSHILKVTSDTLKGLGYITMKDQFGNATCDGYSNVYYDTEQKDYVIKSYIRCSNYTSVGY